MLNFLTTSHLNYTHLSALVIAGYYEGSSRSRVIPVPLLPPEMNIEQDCIYKRLKAGSEAGRTPISTASDGTAGSKTKLAGNRGCGDEVGGDNNANQVICAEKEGHSEFSPSDVDLEGVAENVPVRTTRSIRGAKGKGHVARGGSESRSLLGSSSSTNRERGGASLDSLGANDLKVLKSSPSGGGSSVEEDGDGGRSYSSQGYQSRASEGYQSRASGTEDNSLESSISSLTKQNAANSSQVDTSHREDRKKCSASKGTALLNHPFKLIPAYPISKSPSTITTYHQCAFETVDYIFFSPIACRTGGDGKKRLAGFNLLKRRVLPSTHTLLDLGPQPHQFLSSDHLLLQATFQLTW